MSVLNGMPSKPLADAESPRPIAWNHIQAALGTLRRPEGGYSLAQRGLITTGDGKILFVKIGVDEYTNGWAAKEIRAYDYLTENSYPFIPKLLSTNEDNTGFALDALCAEDGWDWSDTWSKERLDATLAALDALAAIRPSSRYAELVAPVMTDENNGWPKLAASDELQANLAAKLAAVGETRLLPELQPHVERSLNFNVRHDTLVHDDVRADNCPWNGSQGIVKLVDWNWLELGDRRIDLAAMLVHVQASGFDVIPNFKDRLNADALHWMAGFWFEAASKPIWPGGAEKLREVQLRAGITALKLAQTLS